MSSEHAALHDGRLAIRARGLSKTYRIFDRSFDRLKQALSFGWRRYERPFVALDEVNLDIAPGEMVGIVGRNGSGKSTLLQIIAGTLIPTAGEVAVAGRVAALLELGSGFHPEAPGRENIYMNAAILGLSRAEIRAQYERIVAFADIGAFVDQPVKTYSSGMVIRLAFAVAVHVNAQILIVDEALAVGDAAFQAKCFRRIAELRQRGVTILLASHDMTTIAGLCDRAVLLDAGRVQHVGPAKEIAEEYYRRVQQVQRRTGEAPPATAGEDPAGLERPVLTSGSRIGDGSAEVTGFAVRDEDERPTRVLSARQPCRFDVAVRFLEPRENPHVGIALRDAQGAVVLGAHTLFDGQPLGPVPPGRHLHLVFRTTASVRPGRYLVLIGVADHASRESWTDCDAWFDLCEVEVVGQASWGQVNVPVTVTARPVEAVAAGSSPAVEPSVEESGPRG